AIQRIHSIFDSARKIAVNEELNAATREPAVRLLGRSGKSTADDQKMLLGLLEPRTPLPLQVAAVQTLARMRGPQVVTMLLRDWKQHSPTLRNAIFDALLTREEWIRQILSALEKSAVPAGDVPTLVRDRLLKNKNTELQG